MIFFLLPFAIFVVLAGAALGASFGVAFGILRGSAFSGIVFGFLGSIVGGIAGIPVLLVAMSLGMAGALPILLIPVGMAVLALGIVLASIIAVSLRQPQSNKRQYWDESEEYGHREWS